MAVRAWPDQLGESWALVPLANEVQRGPREFHRHPLGDRKARPGCLEPLLATPVRRSERRVDKALAAVILSVRVSWDILAVVLP